jgi:hypothetical protein
MKIGLILHVLTMLVYYRNISVIKLYKTMVSYGTCYIEIVINERQGCLVTFITVLSNYLKQPKGRFNWLRTHATTEPSRVCRVKRNSRKHYIMYFYYTFIKQDMFN